MNKGKKITAEDIVELVASSSRGSDAAIQRYGGLGGEAFTNCGLTQLALLFEPSDPAMKTIVGECLRRGHLPQVRPGSSLALAMQVLREALAQGMDPWTYFNVRSSDMSHLAEASRHHPFKDLVRRLDQEPIPQAAGA